MFAKNGINLPIFIDKLNFKFENNKFLQWQDLIDKGVIRESIQEDGDTVILTKEFSSYDGTLDKKEVITLSNEEFQKYKINTMSTEDVDNEIKKLNYMLDECNRDQNFEKSAILRDKLLVITSIIKT